MTDEEIKEEFEKFITNPWTDEMEAFEKSLTKKGLTYREAYGFYAGFRAAERLAKIEVLENILKDYEFIEFMGNEALNKISDMLIEIKAGR